MILPLALILALLLRAAGPPPQPATRPGAAYVDTWIAGGDTAWRDHMLAAARSRAQLATARDLRALADVRAVMAALYQPAPGQPADPAAVWCVTGRPPARLHHLTARVPGATLRREVHRVAA